MKTYFERGAALGAALIAVFDEWVFPERRNSAMPRHSHRNCLGHFRF
jgi:hypothetical protein